MSVAGTHPSSFTDDEEDYARDDRREVGVENRGERAAVAVLDRIARAATGGELLADALEDEHVRVNGHAEREDEAGDAGHRENRELHRAAAAHRRIVREDAEDVRDEDERGREKRDVEEERDVGDEAGHPVVDEHEDCDEAEAEAGGDNALVLRVFAHGRRNGRLGEDLHRSGQGAGIELVGKLLGGRTVEAAGDLAVRADLALDHRSGNELVVEDDRELAAAASRVLGTAGLVVARERRELLRALGVEAEADGELARGRVALDGCRLKVLASDLRIGVARDEVGRVGAVAVVLKHEDEARIGNLERGETRSVAGSLRDFLPVLGASIARTLLDVALGRDVLGKKLRDELVVLRVGEAELEVGRTLEGCLGGLADFLVNAGELDEKAVVLHSLDHGLVRAHRVDAAANNLYYARVAVLEDFVNLGLDCASLVGDVGILGYDALSELVSVDAEREGRAALKVEAEAKLLLHRRRNVERNDCNEQQNEPFPDVVANRRFLGHSLSNPLF